MNEGYLEPERSLGSLALSQLPVHERFRPLDPVFIGVLATFFIADLGEVPC